MNHSPYTTQPVALCIDSGRQRYYVSRALLKGLSLDVSSSSDDINLPGVDQSTCHTLVHFLYTGTYQVLEDENVDADVEKHRQFKTGVLMHILADRYGFGELKKLATQSANHYGEMISIIDMIKLLGDIPEVYGNSTFFADYLDPKFGSALEKDHNLFTCSEFLDCICNPTFNKTVLRTILRLYIRRVSNLLTPEGKSCGPCNLFIEPSDEGYIHLGDNRIDPDFDAYVDNTSPTSEYSEDHSTGDCSSQNLLLLDRKPLRTG